MASLCRLIVSLTTALRSDSTSRARLRASKRAITATEFAPPEVENTMSGSSLRITRASAGADSASLDAPRSITGTSGGT